MKLFKSALMASAAVLLMAGAANAGSGNPASTSGTASVTVLQPLAVTQHTAMSFGGKLYQEDSASGSTFYTNGTAPDNGGVLGTAANNATFDVTGDASTTFKTTLGGVTSGTSSWTGTAPTLSVQLVSNATSLNVGDDVIEVKGTLAVPAGTYGTGDFTYTVTVEYN